MILERVMMEAAKEEEKEKNGQGSQRLTRSWEKGEKRTNIGSLQRLTKP